MNNCNAGLFCLSISNGFQFYKFFDDKKKDINLLKFQILMELRELFEMKNEKINKEDLTDTTTDTTTNIKPDIMDIIPDIMDMQRDIQYKKSF